MTRLLRVSLASCLACASAQRASVQQEGGAAEAQFILPRELRARPESVVIPPLSFDPPSPRIEVLENGLTVYLLEDHTVPLVSLRALIKAGDVDDPPERLGLAQLTNACMRQGGAGDLGPEQVDEVLERMAAHLAGGVTDEMSEMSLNVRTTDLDKALPIFFDLLRRPRFDETALARTIERAREGVRRRDDSPGGMASRVFEKTVYGVDHPLAREPSLATLGAMGRTHLVAFHAQAYVPRSVRIVVTGDFTTGEMLSRVRSLLDGWTGAGGAARVLPTPKAKGRREVLVVERPIAQTKIRIGHLGYVRHDPREMALRLLDAVLGGSGPTRLFAELRDRRGLAYNVGSLIAPGTVGGQLAVVADPKPENAAELIRETLKILDEVRGARPVTAEELSRAKDLYVNTFAFRFDTAEKVAYERALHDFHGYPADYFKTFRERIQAVTPEEVTAAAKAVIDPSALRIVVVGDSSRMGDLSTFGSVRVMTDATTLR